MNDILHNSLEPIRKLVKLEKSDVSGYRLGCRRPIQTEIRHEKAYHKTEASEFFLCSAPIVAHCETAPSQTNPTTRSWPYQKIEPCRDEWHLVHPVDWLPMEGGSYPLVWRLQQRLARTLSDLATRRHLGADLSLDVVFLRS